jgi:hypothetical protein
LPLLATIKAIACINLNTGDGFDNGKQWQANLGDNWKNRPTHENGENSMLID